MPGERPPWPEEVERVAAFLRAAGAEARIEELRAQAATAEDAARTVGAALEQIVKTLVFDCDGTPVAALVPGDRRCDPRKVARAVGARRARIATAAEVRRVTGFAPGGVAPFPLDGVARVLLDPALLRYPIVWAGAGSERHLASVTPAELLRLARAEAVDVTQAPAYHSEPGEQRKEP